MRIRHDPWSSSLFDLSLPSLILHFPPTSPSLSMNRRTPEQMNKANCSSAGRETDKRRAPSAFSPPAAVAARRPTAGGGGSGGRSPPICQVEHCRTDLSEAKRYYRRHKVCEAHSKAAVVIVAGLRQRFCQQCSRFHEISEFDHSKRSCRRRLAGHNERRRKGSAESQGEGSSRCSQVDRGERIQISLSGKHFQIR